MRLQKSAITLGTIAIDVNALHSESNPYECRVHHLLVRYESRLPFLLARNVLDTFDNHRPSVEPDELHNHLHHRVVAGVEVV
jgi:hypothetical protein